MNASKKSGKKSAAKRPAANKPATPSLVQKFTGLTLSEHLKLKKLTPKP